MFSFFVFLSLPCLLADWAEPGRKKIGLGQKSNDAKAD
jgi:hypothetical protein